MPALFICSNHHIEVIFHLLDIGIRFSKRSFPDSEGFPVVLQRFAVITFFIVDCPNDELLILKGLDLFLGLDGLLAVFSVKQCDDRQVFLETLEGFFGRALRQILIGKIP